MFMFLTFVLRPLTAKEEFDAISVEVVGVSNKNKTKVPKSAGVHTSVLLPASDRVHVFRLA